MSLNIYSILVLLQYICKTQHTILGHCSQPQMPKAVTGKKHAINNNEQMNIHQSAWNSLGLYGGLDDVSPGFTALYGGGGPESGVDMFFQ